MTPDLLSAAGASVRQAALLLHGMTPTDRTWLLDQLSIEQQETLSTLLAELAELGVPSDAEFVRYAVTMPVPGTPRTLANLTPAEIHNLAELLQSEPPMLVAQLLAAGPWSWETPFLDLLDAVKRRHIETCSNTLKDTSGPGRLAAAIVDTVSAQMWSLKAGHP